MLVLKIMPVQSIMHDTIIAYHAISNFKALECSRSSTCTHVSSSVSGSKQSGRSSYQQLEVEPPHPHPHKNRHTHHSHIARPMTRLTDNIDEVCTRIEIKLAADVLITSRRGWHVTVITFKVAPSDKLLNWLMPSVTTWQVVETAKNLFLSPTFSATPATFSRGRAGLILGAKQSFCQSRQKLYFARPAFFLKVQCHLFAGISLEQMGEGEADHRHTFKCFENG